MAARMHTNAAASSSSRLEPAEPFFLPTQSGECFCLHHAADPAVPARGAFVYVHPFAEEMNKCRRMAALQARAFARSGIAVLQIDLSGCGDSSGDFGDARWDIWLDDLARAHAWLAARQDAAVGVWGARLGALLALDFAGTTDAALSDVLLWQPVLNGETYLTQFLRMKLASGMIAAGEGDGAPAMTAPSKGNAGTTAAMRTALAGGERIEVGGYLLAPALAAAIDRLRLGALGKPGLPVHWFEVVTDAARGLPPAAANAANALRERGIDLQTHLAVGPSFWASQEIVEAPQLLAATTGYSADVPA